MSSLSGELGNRDVVGYNFTLLTSAHTCSSSGVFSLQLLLRLVDFKDRCMWLVGKLAWCNFLGHVDTGGPTHWTFIHNRLSFAKPMLLVQTKTFSSDGRCQTFRSVASNEKSQIVYWLFLNASLSLRLLLP